MSCTAGQLANFDPPPDHLLMRCLSPARPPRPVARSLFGRVDHDETQRTLEREMRRIRDDDKLKWNFDFLQERPLSGRYQWEAVGLQRPAVSHDNDEEEDCPELTSARSESGHSRISVSTTFVAGAATLVLPTRELSLSAATRRPSSAAVGEEAAAAAAASTTRQTTIKEYWPEKKQGSTRKRPASTETTNKIAAASETLAKKSKKEPQL